jgi:amino acid permease
VLATVVAGVGVAAVNVGSKMLAARRNQPRSSWQYLLAALACAVFAAACVGLLVKLADAHSNDGYKYIPLMFAGIESLIAALVLAGRSLSRGQAGRHLWLWLHLPAYLTKP